jgi:hypothetical protein
MKLKGLVAVSVVSLSLLAGIPQANAWESNSSTTDFGDKQFTLATYFKSGVGAVPNKRPYGPHKELGVACTAGFFEIGFFDIGTDGSLLTIGSPTAMSVKFDGKLSPSKTPVNTQKGADYVQVNDSKALMKKLMASKSFSVEIALSSGFYRATFNVQDLTKYTSKFKVAGCKF